MTRARCRYTLHLGSWTLPAGCGRVHVQGEEWTEPEAVHVEGLDQMMSGVCPPCGRKMLDLMADYREAKADQVQWAASQRKTKTILPTDPFKGFRPGE